MGEGGRVCDSVCWRVILCWGSGKYVCMWLLCIENHMMCQVVVQSVHDRNGDLYIMHRSMRCTCIEVCLTDV